MHAVTGPGGGSVATETAPGDAHSFTFTAIKPGLFVYHCAVPMAAQHIANGMFGMRPSVLDEACISLSI